MQIRVSSQRGSRCFDRFARRLIKVSSQFLIALSLVLLAASAAHAQSTVTVSWDQNNDAYTAGYRVYYGTSSGNYQWNLDAGNQTSAPLSLTPGSAYYVTVRAYNSAYEHGPASNEATINLATNGAPTAQIQATLQSPNTALVSWQTTNATSVAINGQAVGASGSQTVTISATTTFTIVATGATGATARANATVTLTAPGSPTAQIQATMQSANTALVTWQTTNATSVSINGVAVGASGSDTQTVTESTTYTITATGATGETVRATATVSPTKVPAPTPPTALTADIAGPKVTLNWRPGAGGSAATEYLLYIGTSPWGRDVISGYSVGDALTISGHLPNGRYYARVRARNAGGTSTSSNQVSFIIGKTLTAPTDFEVTWSGTTATLAWKATAADSLEDAPTGYVVEAGSNPGLLDVGAANVGNVTSVSAEVSAGTYYVRVRSVNELGTSHVTEDIALIAPGAPPAPAGLVETSAAGEVPVRLRWAAPAGVAPLGYIVEAGSEPGLSDLAKVQVASVTEFSTEAPPGAYYVRVRAVNEQGAGPASNEILVQR